MNKDEKIEIEEEIEMLYDEIDEIDQHLEYSATSSEACISKARIYARLAELKRKLGK